MPQKPDYGIDAPGVIRNLFVIGGEHVFDVGTGRGLLLIGAARRLTSGKGIGIDVWSTKDLSGNSLEAHAGQY